MHVLVIESMEGNSILIALRMNPSCITTSTIITQDRQAAIVSERDKAAAAARLALVVFVTQSTITAIQSSPNLTVRQRHWDLEVVKCQLFFRVAIESFAPGCLLASGCCYAELFHIANIDTLG